MSRSNTGGVGHTKPATHNRTVGARGETIAAGYLEGIGYRILDRNWHSRYGELDLVVADGETLVAVEVKTRTGLGYGHPLQAITQRKADRLRRLLLDWCRTSAANGAAPPTRAGPTGDTVQPGDTVRPGNTVQPGDTVAPGRPWWAQLRVDAVGIVLRQGVSPSIDHLRGIS